MIKKYKRSFFVAVVLFVLAALAGLAGCHKTVSRASYTSTLLQQISGDTNLVILNAALRRTQLDTVFRSGGPFTVFAPVDSAFISAGLTIERINDLDVDSLRTIIGYHIVTGRVSSTDLLGYVRQKFVSLDPLYEPFVTKNYYGIFLNGIHVDDGNIACADGVLQKIGRVSFPFGGTMYDAILRQPNLSLFAAMLSANLDFSAATYPYQLIPMKVVFTAKPDSQYYSQNSNDEDDTRSYVKPLYTNFTLFIPSDDAFRSVGLTIDSINTLLATNPGTVVGIMENSVVCGEYFTADFLAGFYVNRFRNSDDTRNPNTYSYFQNRQAISVEQDGRAVYVSNQTYAFPFYNTEPVSRGRIIQPDIVASNGVIQVMDSTMVPTQ